MNRTSEQIHESRFAGAARSDDADKFAAADFAIHAIQHCAATVFFRGVFEDNHEGKYKVKRRKEKVPWDLSDENSKIQKTNPK